MHMANNRLLVFARKPAPVQVTYLAYCGTTGLEHDGLSPDRSVPGPAGRGRAVSTASSRSACRRRTGAIEPAIEAPPVNALPALDGGTCHLRLA